MRAAAEGSPADLVWVAALFLVLTVALAYPLSIHPDSTVLPLGGDTRLFLWTLGWDAHALVHRPWGVFDANIFAPERLTLAYSENCLGSALIAAPVLWLTGNPVLAMNTVVLLSCVLCGAGTFFLARQLGVAKGGSLIAALIFAFAPPRFLRLGQLHLAPVQWIPFCLAYLDRYFVAGRPRDLKLAAMFFALQVMTSGHAGLFLIVAIGCMLVWRLGRRENAQVARVFRDLGIVGWGLLIFVLLLMLPYVLVRQEHSWVRTLDEARMWSPNLASFFESPSHVHRVLQAAFGLDTSRARAALFPGVLSLLFAVFGTWAAVREPRLRPRIGAYILIAVVSFWLALGPDAGLYALAFKLPASNFIRVPSRYFTLTLLAIALLAGGGFDFTARRAGTRVRALLAGAAGVLLVAEFAVMPLAVAPYDPTVPAVDRWLAGRPTPFVVAEVPVIDPRNEAMANSRQSIYMMHSTAHWQKTVHGYSGFEPPGHTVLYRELLQFPDAASLQRLRLFGVDYVVVHESYYRPDEWSEVLRRLVAHPSDLGLIYNDGVSRVYVMKRPVR